MGAALTAESAYFSEVRAYTGCLANIGVNAPKQPYFYSFGFNNTFSNVLTSSNMTGASCTATPTASTHFFTANRTMHSNSTIFTAVNPTVAIAANIANATLLRMGAIGYIAPTSNDNKYSAYTVNETGPSSLVEVNSAF